MSDLTITAANVLPGSGATIDRSAPAGATITAGKSVYLDTAATGKWQLADADAATAISRGQGKTGIALNGASDGQPIAVLTEGDITIGATLTAGVSYYVSATPGGICLFADLTTGDYVTLLGVATSTTVLKVEKLYSGVAKT